MAGRARVSLLTVLKVVANPLKLAYNGTEFSLIFGKFNWSLTSVTLGSSTKLAIWDVTADLSLRIENTAGMKTSYTKRGMIFPFYEYSRILLYIHSCEGLIVHYHEVIFAFMGYAWIRALL